MTTERLRHGEAPTLPHTPELGLFRLLTALDSASDDASALRLALAAITTVVSCEQAFFHVWNDRAGQSHIQVSAATEQAFFDEYVTHFRTIDPLATEAVQLRSIREKRSVASIDILSSEGLQQTPFHQRFLARHGGLTHDLCHYAALDEHNRTCLRLLRRADQAPFSPDERSLLDLYCSQITLTLRQRHMLLQARHERDALQASVDLMNQPVFLFNSHARVIACNRAATTLAREGRQIRLADGQLLPGRLVDHASWLPQALERLRNSESRSHLQVLPSRGKGRSPYYGVLSWLAGDNKPPGPAVALLTLIDMQQSAPRHSTDELCRAFAFTRAEARIADALIAGMDTEEISNTFLIRRDTVRSHIKRLLAKTGTHGHADLQKLLLRISPNFTTLQQKSVNGTAK
ncbi:helix-turn-helix transcriptional regulator [Xanthomonadaceae bacterium JHOS43]|nr:helix-turn-helix transcriptional regulator [Xanthomonadaceae bacterium JHOS43]